MEFFRQEYWSGLPLPLPGYLPDPGIKPESHALQADSLPSELPGKPHYYLLGLKWQTTPHSFWKMPWTEKPSKLYSPCDRKSWTWLKDQTTTISKIQFCVSLSVFVFYLVFCVLSVLTLFPMASGGFCTLFTYSHPAFSSPGVISFTGVCPNSAWLSCIFQLLLPASCFLPWGLSDTAAWSVYSRADPSCHLAAHGHYTLLSVLGEADNC